MFHLFNKTISKGETKGPLGVQGSHKILEMPQDFENLF
jgi:hypothetical protein